MTRNLLAVVLAVGCSGPTQSTAPARHPADPQPVSTSATRPVVDTRPDVPTGEAARRDAEFAAKAAGFIDAFTNGEPAFTRDGKRVVFVSNRDGLPQLYLAARPDEPATRLLTSANRVTNVTVAAGGKDLLFMSDTGADEHWSFFRVGLDGKHLIELTPGERLNRDGFIVPDGRPSTLFFSARKMSEAKSTLYSGSAIAASEPKPIYTSDKPAFLEDVSADGTFALMLQYPTRAENYLFRVDLTTGKADRLFPAEGKVSIFSARVSRDKQRILVATDNGEEQALILALDPKTGKTLAKHAITPPTAQINGMTVAKEGGLIAVSLLVGNHSEIRLLDARTLAPRTQIQMPLGQGGAGEFSEDGKRLAVQWSTPQIPTDIYAVDTRTGKVEPLRHEGRPMLASMPAITPMIVDIPAFDGGKIPTNVYTAGGPAAKRPVLVVYHGGPSGTSVIRWNPSIAFFLSLGYIVVEPNVRGSGGFGRAFEAADNGPKRLDAFKDIETSARWVAAQPWADKDRMVVYGGSYGGYTTLVALARWPEVWRAGVDLFGVVNLESFMATTSGLIRDIFILEFGDPEKDAEFLTSISPLTDVAKIVDPTFVYAGANDPRVPRSESDLIVKALRERKIPSEYYVADNEGHSFAHRETQIAYFSRVARFLETHLR